MEQVTSHEKLLARLNETLNSIPYELQDSANRNRFLEKIAVFGILVPWLMIIPFVWLPIQRGAVMLLGNRGHRMAAGKTDPHEDR